jgi:ribose-phosphate pyrophosphokinase
MSAPLLFCLDGNEKLYADLLQRTPLERGDCLLRHFPDGESYVRILSACAGRDAVILCSLHQPDRLILPLLFCADTLRELGARSVGLLVPYLAYMRQDARFQTGEAVSSGLFAQLLSAHFDWLITVDPHLHRHHSLAEIYSIPHAVVHAAPLLADWVRQQVERPLLIGPDSESAQWVAAVAARVDAPWAVLEKVRRGDRNVEIVMPDFGRWPQHTPVLVDDIISTGHTLLEATAQLRGAGLRAPVCAAVHGLFAERADEKLLAAGVQRIATSNSIPHATNAFDLSAVLVDALCAQLARTHN